MKFLFSGLFVFLYRIIHGNGDGPVGNPTTADTNQDNSNINEENIMENPETHVINKFFVGVGINNYPGTSNDLRGCVNDCNDWANELKVRFGFSDIVTILDEKATIKNVKNQWKQTLDKAKDGDLVVFTFSGHGTSVADRSGDEEDGKDEAICLYDGLLIDDDIRSLFSSKKDGVRMVFISDSCHSGTVSRSFLDAMSDNEFYSKPKYLPPSDIIDASSLGMIPISGRAIFSPTESDMNHILISGCLPTEYSYDANFRGKFNGAMTYVALSIIKANPDMTYAQLHTKIREQLPNRRYPQTPQLEGPTDMKNQKMF